MAAAIALRASGSDRAALILAGSPNAPMIMAQYALPMLPTRRRWRPTGSVPSLERFSKSVMSMKTEPTRNAETTARIGTTRRAMSAAQALHSPPPISMPTFS